MLRLLRRRRSSLDRADRGVAAVEFALILTLLLGVVFGLIDFGTAYNRKLTEDQAAREGARLAALGGTTSTVKSRTQAAASGMTLNTATDVHVCFRGSTDTSACTADSGSPVCTSASTGDAVVTVSQVYRFVTPVAVFLKLSNSTLTISATGRMPCGG